HLIWFPARWPESYSYTLSAALASGIPILAPDLGAFIERLDHQPLAWRYDIDQSAAQLLDWLERFRVLRQQDAWPPPAAVTRHLEEPALDPAWYRTIYPWLAHRQEPATPCDPGVGSDIPLHPARRPPFNLRQRDPVSVVVIPEPLGAHVSPCAYIRLLLPLAAAMLEHSAIRFASPAAAMHYQANLFVTQRLAFPDLQTARAFHHQLNAQGSRLIYDLDDALLDLDDDAHHEADQYQPARAVITAMLQTAAEVWLSTATLAERVGRLNAHCQVIPNQLDQRLWRLLTAPAIAADRPVRLLYMGTKTHRHDWLRIAPALNRLVQRHGSGLEIHIVGIDEPGRLPSWTLVHEPPPALPAVYPAFVHWLQNLGPFAIGIAPLTPHPFNLAKSGIKFMDYTALGAVTVAVDLPPYQSVIRHNENGLLVTDTVEDWEQALEWLIAQPEQRQALWRQARQDWLTRYSYDATIGNPLAARLMEVAQMDTFPAAAS
ncbi:MAG: glycosyltransferase, partial [Candidatus Competibacteraceae bacterium]|nr:glycosyltransferase [Candidatus Competibacteraceae bacterium]